MLLQAVPPRVKNADRQHDGRENGQQVNRAPWAPCPHLVDGSRRDDHGRHQCDPNPSGDAMTYRPLRRGQLKNAKPECQKRGKGVDLDYRRRRAKRLECHFESSSIAWGSKSTLLPCGSTAVAATNSKCERPTVNSRIDCPRDRPGDLHTARVPELVPSVFHNSVRALPSVGSTSTRITK
jgi:hypothetical protein